MWESITNLLGGPNAPLLIFFLIVVIWVVMHLSKKGIIAIHTSAVSLGGADKERNIIRHQIEVVHALSFELPEILSLDITDYTTKYMIERVYDKTVEWVLFNHMSSTPIYIESKTTAIYNLLLSLDSRDDIRRQEVRDGIREWVVHLVDQVIGVRKYYTEHKR